MSAQLDDEDSLGMCSYCRELKPIVMSRPTQPGRGQGKLKAFWRTCCDCERIPERRSPRSSRISRVASTTPPGAWWNRD